MKRFLAFLLMACVAMFATVGCGGGDEKKKGDDKKEEKKEDKKDEKADDDKKADETPADDDKKKEEDDTDGPELGGGIPDISDLDAEDDDGGDVPTP